MSKEKEGHFEFLEGYPRDVVAVEAKGYISADDYEKVLNPEVEGRIHEEGKVKVLIVIGPEFQGFSAGAAWEDAKLGLSHISDFARIAVVSDKDWVKAGSRIFAPLMRAEVGVFGMEALDEAKAWICRNEPDQDDGARVDADYKIPPLEDKTPPMG